MNEFQSKSIDACKAIWARKFKENSLDFMGKNGGSAGMYYIAQGELPHGKIALVIYEDEAGVSYTDNGWSKWYKFIRGGWDLPSYMFEKPDYDSPEALSAALVDRFTSLIEKNGH